MFMLNTHEKQAYPIYSSQLTRLNNNCGWDFTFEKYYYYYNIYHQNTLRRENNTITKINKCLLAVVPERKHSTGSG